MAENLTYAAAGVDIDAGAAMVEAIKPLVRATRRPGADAEIGGFGGLFDLRAAGLPRSRAGRRQRRRRHQGARSPSRPAYSTPSASTSSPCASTTSSSRAPSRCSSSTISPPAKLDPRQGADIVRGIAAACVESGCALIGGETAEMPGLYAAGDFDLAGFAVGAAERGTLLPRPGLAAGDVVFGLPSSGLHSNGFSLVRRIVAQAGLGYDAPAPFDRARSLGEALLTPTRLYVKPLLAALKATDAILALAHVTGGGFPENLPRVLPEYLAVRLDLAAFAPPPVFSWLAAEGPVAEAEMLRTFNCGIGMVAFARRAGADEAARALEAAGLAPVEIGRLVERAGASVVAEGRLRL